MEVGSSGIIVSPYRALHLFYSEQHISVSTEQSVHLARLSH